MYADGGIISLEGNNFINRNCNIICHSTISIGKGTTIGPNVSIYDHDHNYKSGKGVVTTPIIIGSNVWIGAGCIILQGTIIGNEAIIGAGTVIKNNIPPETIAVNSKDLLFKPK